MGQSHLVTKLRNMLRFILLVFCLSYVTAEPYTGPLASIENHGGQATVVEHHSPYGYAQSGQYVAVNPGAVHHAKRSTWTGECFNNLGKSVECDPVQPTAYAGVPQTGVPEAVVPWDGECVNYLGETVKCISE